MTCDHKFIDSPKCLKCGVSSLELRVQSSREAYESARASLVAEPTNLHIAQLCASLAAMHIRNLEALVAAQSKPALTVIEGGA